MAVAPAPVTDETEPLAADCDSCGHERSSPQAGPLRIGRVGAGCHPAGKRLGKVVGARTERARIGTVPCLAV